MKMTAQQGIHESKAGHSQCVYVAVFKQRRTNYHTS